MPSPTEVAARTYVAAWQEPDAAARARLIEACFAADARIVAPGSVICGRAALAKAIGRTHWLYSRYINRMHRRSGHAWQNRFYSCPLDDEHVVIATRYAERNPLRAGICRLARRYRWSSAAVHCGAERDELGLLDLKTWRKLAAGLDWDEQLGAPLEDRELAGVRRATHTGRPLASDGLISKLEHKLGRRLRPLPVGRPRKPKPHSKRRAARKRAAK